MKIDFNKKLPSRLQKYLDDWINEHLSDLKHFIDLFYQSNWDEEKTHEHSPEVGFTISLNPAYPRNDGSRLNDVFHLELFSNDSTSFDIILAKWVSSVGSTSMAYVYMAQSRQKFDDWNALTVKTSA